MNEKMKNIPQRTCIGCRQKKDKTGLIRIVCNKEGEISVDKNEKKQGRGAYICDNKECLEKAIKSKGLERAFKRKIEEEVYNNLRGVVIE